MCVCLSLFFFVLFFVLFCLFVCFFFFNWFEYNLLNIIVPEQFYSSNTSAF